MSSIAITGNRNLTTKDIEKIRERISKLMMRAGHTGIESIYFGGARGADTVALQAALDFKKKTKLIVVLPCKLINQPRETWEATALADELIELGNPITPENSFLAYKLRNYYMVDHSDELIAFWNGDKHSGTYSCINYADGLKRKIETIKISGKDK